MWKVEQKLCEEEKYDCKDHERNNLRRGIGENNA